MEDRPSLFVEGATTADTLEAADSEVYIQKGTFKYFVWGDYNHGILETALVDTPWVINSDHDLRVTAGKTTKWIDNHGDDDDYDFGSENIATSFVAEVLGGDEKNEVDIEKFYAHLVAGKPVLAKGAKTGKEAALAQVKGAKGAKQTELVLTTKKLKKFPPDALKMPWLTKLVLDGNEIGEVPDDRQPDRTGLSSSCDLANYPGARSDKLRVACPKQAMEPKGGRRARVQLPKSFGKQSRSRPTSRHRAIRGDDDRRRMNVYRPASIAS
jgi:hypothetical protein